MLDPPMLKAMFHKMRLGMPSPPYSLGEATLSQAMACGIFRIASDIYYGNKSQKAILMNISFVNIVARSMLKSRILSIKN
jgi:hypothetical protein